MVRSPSKGVAEEALGYSATSAGYTQVFRKLLDGVLSKSTGEGMIKLARLRNLVVHRYWEVDDIRVHREVKEEGIGLVTRFVEEVAQHVSRA